MDKKVGGGEGHRAVEARGAEAQTRRSRTPDLAIGTREQVIANRETWVAARERATGEHDAVVTEREEAVAQREELIRLREEALRARSAAEEARSDRELLLAQMRGANEKLVLATVRANELADQAIAARVVAARSAAVEAEGRRRAEALAAQLLESETALRASEARFRTLANTLPMLAWYANPDGEIAWFNDRWYEYTGTTMADDGKWKWSELHDVEDLPRVAAKWQAAVALGEPWEDMFRVRRHDGALRWFLGRALPLRNDRGEIERWFGTNIDIDDQKRAEAQSLANDRAKDEFIAMLGHELRNPLSPILITLDLMAAEAPTVFERERRIIENQVRHLVRLVDDLLDISRITEGKVELQREPIEMEQVVARAVEMSQPIMDKKHQQLTVRVPAHGVCVDGDPVRLTQVIGNLLANAAKYTPPHGTIDVHAERTEGAVIVRIKDSGVGISEEMLPRIFDLFAQERQTLDRAQGGLGLGLTIVRRLVAMHGGTVTAESAGIGQGSEFTVTLPACIAAVRTEAPREPLRASAEPLDLRVLVVDDNRHAAEPIGHLLRAMFACEVRVAFDGPSALTIARDFAPDLALLDLGLPGMDGYELARQLRAQASGPLHLIAITGYGSPADVRRTRRAGFDVHLVKPVTAHDLRDRILEVAHPAAPVVHPQ